MSDIWTQIDLVSTGTRGLTIALHRNAIDELHRLHARQLWFIRLELVAKLAPLTVLWHTPTEEQCRQQIDILEMEADEMRPWVDTWPEHRSEATLETYQLTVEASKHFRRKLAAIEELRNVA